MPAKGCCGKLEITPLYPGICSPQSATQAWKIQHRITPHTAMDAPSDSASAETVWVPVISKAAGDAFIPH